MLASALLVLMAIKTVPTVMSLRASINLQTKFNFDFDSSFSKFIFTKYYDTYDCEGENGCPGDYDINSHKSIKNRQPMWKNNLKRTSGEYVTTQTITFSW